MNSKTRFITNFLIISFVFLLFFGIFKRVLSNNYEYDNTKKADSYSEIYSLVKSINKNNNYNKLFGFLPIRTKSSEFATNEGAIDTSKSIDYSDTNLQVLGVQESDIIKTDGEYIYALSSEHLFIIKVSNNDMSLISKIKHNDYSNNFFEIYLKDNKLVALNSIYDNNYSDEPSNRDMYYYGYSNETGVVVFDITNKEKPIKESSLSQSGSYVSSRMIDNNLYLITNYYIYDENIKEREVENYIPYTNSKEKELINIDDIYIVPNPSSSQYIVVSGIDINSPNEFVSSKSIFGCGNNIYANLENLFIASYDSFEEDGYMKTKTNLLRFSINEGVVNLEATGFVKGNILNQFSMDQTNNYFRIVTTSNEYKIYNSRDGDSAVSSIDWNDNSKNNLYILDEDFNMVSKIEDLAKGERVYSVRFDSDFVYFVTFRQVDPLFVVDLTNPNNPIILSELKIPGFSEYLQVYDENLLFGLGKEADDEGRVLGIKISMFDISDKTDVEEKYKLFLGREYMWSEASYNHKAILVSKEKNLIGFPVNDGYILYNFNLENGFEKLLEVDVNNNYYYGSVRGLYIDNSFFIFNIEHLKSYDMSDFSLYDTLSLGK